MQKKLEKVQPSLPMAKENAYKYHQHLRSALFFIVGSLIATVSIDVLPNSSILRLLDFGSLQKNVAAPQLTYAVYGKSQNEDHLKHVLDLLSMFGYKRVGVEENWNLLWAHDYPHFEMREKLRNLKSNQIVNHLPGCGFLTSKVDLSTTLLPFLPRSFRIPQDKDAFLKYSSENRESLFVEKHNEHRQILIKSSNNVSFDENKFIQEYIRNPFLVDGYKFDIGVYVLITSINPTRVYIYTGDVLFRYCPIKYYPFKPDVIDKYIVGDDYLPTWEVPSLMKYYNQFGGSMRASFDAYVRDNGSLDPSIIWQQIEDILRQTIVSKEADIDQTMRSYKTKNFFELIRFDFIVDDNLKVYLMEANMSPNLSSAHFKQNSILYEQILYSSLNIVGVASPIINPSPVVCNSLEVNEIISADKNIASDLNVCAQNFCDQSCKKDECALCLPCLSGSDYEALKTAHREHLHRVDMKRILPKPILDPLTFNIQKEIQGMTKQNKLMTRWFFNKCLYDRSWCN